MAITELYTFTESVTTTEWSMTTDTAGPDVDTTDGVFQFVLDLSGLADGDVFRFRLYEKARAADTQRICYEAVFQNDQGSTTTGSEVWVSPPTILMHGWDATVIKLSGTDRTITGSVRQIT